MRLNEDALKTLFHIGRNGPVSRGHIAQTLNFTTSRTARVTERLLKSGLIHEVGQVVSGSGRPSILLDLRDSNHLLCGGLLSYSSSLHLILMDLRANILAEERMALPRVSTVEAIVEKVGKNLDTLMKRNGKGGEKRRLLGVGIGASGTVDPREGRIHTCPGFPNLRETPLSEIMGKRLGVPVYIENDVAMSTLAEMWFGKGRRCANFLFFHIGPGLRMGIVLNGQLYRGETGNAGEIGHVLHDRRGPYCSCGNAGCLEAFMSTQRFLERTRSLLRPNSTSLLGKLCAFDPARLELGQVFQAAAEGDRLARNLVEKYLRPLGITLAGAVNIFDIRKIILGGLLAQAGGPLPDILLEAIHRLALPVLSRNVTVEVTEFHDNGTAVGGGALVLQKVCEGEITL